MIDVDIQTSGESGASTPPSRLNSRDRILVADDEPIILRLTTGMLARSGFDVDAAEDGAEAWDALQVKQYDLLITDNNMPNLTGVELIQKLHASRVPLPVIMATGSPPDLEFTDIPGFHPVATLLKPFTNAELLATVKAVLGGIGGARQYLDSRQFPQANPQLLACSHD